jgi:ankyrin repeat protein
MLYCIKVSLYFSGLNVLHYAIEQKCVHSLCKKPQDKEICHTYINNMLKLLQEHGATLVSRSGQHALYCISTVREAEWVLDQDPGILNKDPSPNENSILFNTINKLGGKVEGDKIIDLYIRRGAIEKQPFELISQARYKKCKFFVIESLLKRFPLYGLSLDGQTLITQYGNDVTIIDKLIAIGANVNTTDLGGNTVLWTAVKKGSVAAIKKILDLGADPGEFANASVCVLLPICHEFTKKRCRLQSYLDLLSKVLAYPSIKASPMSQSLEHAFAFIFEDLFNSLIKSDIIDRLKDVLTCIFNSNENIKSIVFKYKNIERHYKVAGYTLDYQSYDFMGYAIHCYTKAPTSTLQLLAIEKLNNIFFNFEISVSNTSRECITALTTALMISEDDNIRACLPGSQQSIKEIDHIINKLIQLGVKTNTQVLQIKEVKSEIYNQVKQEEILKLIKTTHLSDALLLALLRNKLELTKKLISDWCGPPLALMIFNPNWDHANFIPWFEMLQSYGGIPHGTPMFELVKHLLDELKEKASKELGSDVDYSCKFQAFEKHLGEWKVTK